MSEDLTQRFSDGDLKLVLARLDSIVARLNSLEEKVDRRLQETQPIWRQVLARLDSIETEMRSGFEMVEQKLNVLSEDMLSVRAKQKSLEGRVSKLESEPTH